MRIDTRIILKDYEGNDILNPHQDKEGKIELKPLSIRDCIITAINTPGKDEIFTAEMKARSYQLSTKIFTNHEISLTPEEIVYIKERIDSIWNTPVVVGKIKEALEQVEQLSDVN